MTQPPHEMMLGDDEGDYYRGTFKTGARSAPSSAAGSPSAGNEV
jgi:hypothetical protein